MTTTPYDRIADWYDQKVHKDWNGHAATLPYLFELLGDIAGNDVCDVACGQGTITRKLAEAGGRVVGVDTSRRMLGLAQSEEDGRPLGISYVQDDARHLRSLPNESFDLVTCTWALMDIEDLASCLRSVARILRSGGAFVSCITHPCFTGPGAGWKDADYIVGSYLREGFWVSENPDGVRSRVGAHHRTVSTYVNELVAAGLAIERFLEPARVHVGTLLPNAGQVPGSLYMRCRKPFGDP
jgi:SAM-dependent methyltransferase